MAFEVVCGGCQGRLLVETPGVVVACPHCGMQLTVPAAPAAATAEPPATPAAPTLTVDPNAAATTATPPASATPAQQPARVPQTESASAPASEPVAAASTETVAAQPTQTATQPQPEPVSPVQPEVIAPQPSATDAIPETAAAPIPAPAPEPAGDAIPDFSGLHGAEEPAAPWMPPAEDAAPAVATGVDQPQEFPDFSATGTTDASAAAPQPAAPTPVAPAPDVSEPDVAPTVSSDAGSVAPAASAAVADPNADTVPHFGDPATTPSTTATPPAPVASAPEETVPAPFVGNGPTTATTTFEPAAAAPVPAVDSTSAIAAAAPPETAAVPSTMVAATTRRQSNVVPKLWFIIALSYASAVTIACIYLFSGAKAMGPDASRLESLPDLVPPMNKKETKILLQLAPEGAPMPPGHTLALGDSQRFGSVKVTPIKVTRSRLNFVHYTGSSNRQKDSVGPVLKLWLRFENVSRDQEFAPLDKKLIWSKRQSKSDLNNFRANNFLCQLDEKSEQGNKILMYDHLVEDEWDLVEQNVGRKVGPSGVYVTYIPSAPEGIGELDDELVWRVQFRKGYNRESLRGVTTLIEVVFDSSEIIDEVG